MNVNNTWYQLALVLVALLIGGSTLCLTFKKMPKLGFTQKKTNLVSGLVGGLSFGLIFLIGLKAPVWVVIPLLLLSMFIV